MSHLKDQRQWALVTGASSGLGREFARALAARKINLVLVARREAEMLALATEFKRDFAVEVVVEQLDLSSGGSADVLQGRLGERGIEIDIFIGNAAFGLSGRFIEQELPRIREMLQVDIMTLVELTYMFGRRMAARGRGHILLVASLAAYQPTPLLAAYGAAKNFVLAFGVALHVELAPKVGVTVVSPGLMDTGFFSVSGYQPRDWLRRTMVPPAKVAAAGLKALFKGKSSVVVGRWNQLSVLSNRLTTRGLQAKVAYRISKE